MPGGRDVDVSAPAELPEPGVVDPEVMGDLVVERVADRRDEALRIRFARDSGPRNSVILLATAALSTPQRVRGTPS